MSNKQDNFYIPAPGTAAALVAGCTCPVLDNNHGAGINRDSGTEYWVTEGCPVHTMKQLTKFKDQEK